jgi:hypothetical protein
MAASTSQIAERYIYTSRTGPLAATVPQTFTRRLLTSLSQLFNTVYSDCDCCVELDTDTSYDIACEHVPIPGHAYVFSQKSAPITVNEYDVLTAKSTAVDYTPVTFQRITINSLPQLFRTIYKQCGYCLDLVTHETHSRETDQLPVSGHPYVFYQLAKPASTASTAATSATALAATPTAPPISNIAKQYIYTTSSVGPLTTNVPRTFTRRDIASFSQLFRTIYSDFDYCVDIDTTEIYKPKPESTDVPVHGHAYVFYRNSK